MHRDKKPDTTRHRIDAVGRHLAERYLELDRKLRDCEVTR